ncbi:non-canonical purine NTP pyrophosphatase [Candidatus Saccharibacteria bacterium]|nr:non-canonical purine NTP pyrophosphatase [Candidatus Saccharibacteria bacterium]
MRATFVTGNAKKAKYFSELIGIEVPHRAVAVHEIQSLDLREIAEYKVKLAYEQLSKPVIVEDVSLVIKAMGKLPGPFIKWFIDEIGLEGVCRLADVDQEREAVASSIYAYYDGQILKYFAGSLEGTIADRPRGGDGFGWNPVFIPHYSKQTLAEMDDQTFEEAYLQVKAINQLKNFLDKLIDKQ